MAESSHTPPAPGVSARYQAQSLAGRCALVTGASSGIGKECAWRLAELGCRLILAARRTDRLTSLAAELEAAYGTRCHCVTLDVTDTQAVLALPGSLPADFADVSVLINNAGGAHGVGKVWDNDMADAQLMLSANVMGTISCTRAFAPGMVERQQGHIVNLSSIAGVEHYAGGSVYCATKAAVNAFTSASRKDLVDTPVKISTVAPGFVNTEFANVRFKGDGDKAAAVYAGMKFGGSLLAEDVADNVIYVLTRPLRVHVMDLHCNPTCQASVKEVARE